MSRVIKNNDGVAIVEGTPAASLVKDVNKFFAAKPPERMAGESVSQPRKLDPRAINTRRPTPKDLEQMNNLPVESPAIRSGGRPAESEVVLDTFMGRGAAEPEVVLDTFMGNRKKEPEEQGRRRTIGTGKEPEVVLDTLMGRRPTMARKKEPEVVLDTLKEGSKFSESAIRSGRKREVDDLVKQQVKEEAEGRKEETPPQEKEMKREEALDKTRECKRLRFAERSADEQEATKGKFITTLGN